MEDINLNALGQAIDDTWGRSSTPKTASYSVKFSFYGGNRILASYQVIINFVSERQMIDMKRRCAEESLDIINAHVKLIKATYKKLTDDSINFKEESSADSLEVIGLNVHNPKRTALFRRKTIFEVA